MKLTRFKALATREIQALLDTDDEIVLTSIKVPCFVLRKYTSTLAQPASVPESVFEDVVNIDTLKEEVWLGSKPQPAKKLKSRTGVLSWEEALREGVLKEVVST